MKAYSLDLRTKIVESVRRGISKSETVRRFGVNKSSLLICLLSLMFAVQVTEASSYCAITPQGSPC
jgi:hypothetical protein